jgi:hypothetical protein
MAYPTLEEVKAYLDVTTDGDDDLLTDLLTQSISMIEGFAGFTFEADADSERFFSPITDVNPYDKYELYFDTWLATTPTTVSNKDDGTPEVITSGNYIMLPQNQSPHYGIKLLSSKGYVWTYEDDPEIGISITGKWGWSEDAPEKVKHAVRRLVAFVYRQKDTSSDLDRPLLTGDGVTVMPSQLPHDVMKLIKPYRWRTS